MTPKPTRADDRLSLAVNAMTINLPICLNNLLTFSGKCLIIVDS